MTSLTEHETETADQWRPLTRRDVRDARDHARKAVDDVRDELEPERFEYLRASVAYLVDVVDALDDGLAAARVRDERRPRFWRRQRTAESV